MWNCVLLLVSSSSRLVFAVIALLVLVVCLCDRVVSLRDGGDGLCWGGKAVGGGRCVSVRLPLLVFPFFFLFLFLFCVGVRGSARAAQRARTFSPNTIVLSVLLLSSLFSSSRPAFLRVGMAVCVYHVLVCSVGMTAMGSLSRSSSFFW